MKKEDIHLSDWNRILFGEAPVMFLVEVLIRSVITYLVLLVIIRLLGKRMSGKLTHTEMAVTLMFGAIVSSAMQIPDRGIVEGAFILALVLVFQQGITLWALKRPRFEDQMLGQMSMLVKDGVLQTEALRQERITRSQLFRMLRSEKIMSLGMVERVYMETTGSFSILKFKEPRPGLSILPDEDEDIQSANTKDEKSTSCSMCGTTYQLDEQPAKCACCGSNKFVPAVK